MSQTLIPGLAETTTQYQAVLPAQRILETLTISGKRFGCWELRCPAGGPLDEELVFHFATQAEAAAELDEVLQGYGPDEKAPEVVIVQLILGCFTLSCAECQSPLGDDEREYSAVHHSSLTTLEQDAEDQDWTTNGQLWNCSTCPPLEPATGSGVWA